MKLYRITFMVLGSDTISPLVREVIGENEEDAKWNFLESKNFYSTNDEKRVIIISIRQIT